MIVNARKLITVIEGISLGEAPRWRDGALYLSDIHADRVLKVNTERGTYEVLIQWDKPVSGLGWLPDGRLLVVSMHDRKVLRQELDGSIVEHADLGGIATWHTNDMVVAPDGSAYVVWHLHGVGRLIAMQFCVAYLVLAAALLLLSLQRAGR